MAVATVRQTKDGLTSKPYAESLIQASRKTHWLVSQDSAKTVDDLTFTSRDAQGCINWWDVSPPKTDYWHAHEMLGRAYAFEVLDLLNNPAAEKDNESSLGFILGAIARWQSTVAGAATGMADGFFQVVSEYVSTGTASR